MPSQKASSFAEDLAALQQQPSSFASDLAELTREPPKQPDKPQGDTREFRDGRPVGPGTGFKATLKAARENPGTVGALFAGAAAAPFTGGMSLLPAMGAEAAAGATGALAGHGTRAALTGEGSVGEALKDAAVQGALGAGGPVLGGVLRTVGRGLYRAAALPINKMGKYGDLIAEGLKKRVPVSASGLDKATDLRNQASAAKKAAVSGADQRAVFRAQGIADDAEPALRSSAMAGARAAQGNVMPKFEAKLGEFTKANPDGTLTPSNLEAIKHTLDDKLGGAYRKLRMREPVTPQERFNLELAQAAGRAQQSVIPEYAQMNRNVMDAEGLRRMIERRVSPGSSGGNQGLENALTIVGGLNAIPARLAMLPPVMSRAGIAANEASKVAPAMPSFARALLALLSGEQQHDE